MNKQEYVELQTVMPQAQYTYSVIRSEQSTTEKTIAHLYAERLATPASVAGELSENHPTQSKSKCLYTTHRAYKHGASVPTEAIGMIYHHAPIPNHVIDYYIYTLEHILI